MDKFPREEPPFWSAIPPQVNSLVIPAQVSVGLPFQLRADLSGPGPIAQSWQLGDGRQVDVSNPVVVYPAPGMYDVTLTANNALAAATATRRITVIPHPTAQFKVDDASPGVGQIVTFINESGGEAPITYQWDFGDGSTSTETNPTHQYAAPGTYPASLTIENAYGRSNAFWAITVGQPPTAEMILGDLARTGQPVMAQAVGDASVTAFQWDMGDGRTIEGAQISHMYYMPGDYYVTLTAVNEYGRTQISRWLRVEPGVLSIFLPIVPKADLEAASQGAALDPLGIVLEPVDLDAPFAVCPLYTSDAPAERSSV